MFLKAAMWQSAEHMKNSLTDTEFMRNSGMHSRNLKALERRQHEYK